MIRSLSEGAWFGVVFLGVGGVGFLGGLFRKKKQNYIKTQIILSLKLVKIYIFLRSFSFQVFQRPRELN